MSVNDAFWGVPVYEDSRVAAGSLLVLERKVIAHPLDVLLLSRPDLDAVGRVMVLVDRVVVRALARIDAW